MFLSSNVRLRFSRKPYFRVRSRRVVSFFSRHRLEIIAEPPDDTTASADGRQTSGRHVQGSSGPGEFADDAVRSPHSPVVVRPRLRAGAEVLSLETVNPAAMFIVRPIAKPKNNRNRASIPDSNFRIPV